MRQPELWIGLVELKPLDRKAYGAAGAFTNIVTRACDAQAFREKCEVIASELNVCGRSGRRGTLGLITKERALSEEIDDMVLRAESNPNAIVYGTFHRSSFDRAQDLKLALFVASAPKINAVTTQR
jgi:hypothetical protein